MSKLRALVLGAALGLAGGQALAADPGLTDKEITIGLFNPMSGPLVSFGYDSLYAAKMWYDDVNKKGGIHGRMIKTIIEDDKCSAQDVVAIVKKFVTVDNVFLINGGACTGPSVAAQEYVTREKVPYVMINAAGDGAVFPPTRYTFGGAGGTQRSVGAGNMEFAIKQLQGKRIAYISHDDDFGNANTATALGVAKRLGGNVVAVERISPRITDATAPLLNIRAANPDVLVSTAYPAPAVLIAQKYGEFNMTKIALVQAVQGIPVPSAFVKNVGNDAALVNFYYSSPLNDLTNGPKQQKWLAMYKAAYPDRTPGAFMAYGLPLAMAITDALQRAGKDLTREKFIDAMEKVDIETGVTAGNTAFGPNRRDGYRGSIFIKFDGKTETLMPGAYFWNGTDGM